MPWASRPRGLRDLRHCLVANTLYQGTRANSVLDQCRDNDSSSTLSKKATPLHARKAGRYFGDLWGLNGESRDKGVVHNYIGNYDE